MIVSNFGIASFGIYFQIPALGFLPGPQKKIVYCLGQKGKDLSLPQIKIKWQVTAIGLALEHFIQNSTATTSSPKTSNHVQP